MSSEANHRSSVEQANYEDSVLAYERGRRDQLKAFYVELQRMRSASDSAASKTNGLRSSVEHYDAELEQHRKSTFYVNEFTDTGSEAAMDWRDVYAQCGDTLKRIYEAQVLTARELDLLEEPPLSSEGPTLMQMGFPFKDDDARALLGEVKASPTTLKLKTELSESPSMASGAGSDVSSTAVSHDAAPIPRSDPGWRWYTTFASSPTGDLGNLRKVAAVQSLTSREGPSPSGAQ